MESESRVFFWYISSVKQNCTFNRWRHYHIGIQLKKEYFMCKIVKKVIGGVSFVIKNNTWKFNECQNYMLSNVRFIRYAYAHLWYIFLIYKIFAIIIVLH